MPILPYDGPLFDAHVHTAGPFAQPETLLAALDRGAHGHRIERAVLLACPVRGAGARRLPWAYHRTVGNWRAGRRLSWFALGSRWLRPTLVAPDNDLVARLVATAPDRLVGFAWLDPGQADPVSEARLWTEQRGLSGIKLHGWFHRTHLLAEGVQQLAHYAGQRRLPILVHPGLASGGPPALDELARRYPDTPLIVAHLDETALDAAATRDNVFLDTSGLCLTPRHLERALRRAGPTKLIFGSDAPAETGGDLGYSLRLLANARLPEPDLARICWENLHQLLAASGPGTFPSSRGRGERGEGSPIPEH